MDVDKQQLCEYLERLSRDDGNEDTLPDRETNVVALSLAPRDEWQVGTITFSKKPSEFALCSPNNPIKIRLLAPNIDATEISIDVDFYGMTPLYCPSEPATTE
jgi:hypothetical protein